MVNRYHHLSSTDPLVKGAIKCILHLSTYLYISTLYIYLILYIYLSITIYKGGGYVIYILYVYI